MADDMALAAMFEYYERGGERGRLDEPAGQLEFARTRQTIARRFPGWVFGGVTAGAAVSSYKV
jgi:hypothetical protein